MDQPRITTQGEWDMESEKRGKKKIQTFKRAYFCSQAAKELH